MASHIDLDRESRRGTSTIQALMHPVPGDVFRYRDSARWIVITTVVEPRGKSDGRVVQLFFDQRAITGPFDSTDYSDVSLSAFQSSYIAEHR